MLSLLRQVTLHGVSGKFKKNIQTSIFVVVRNIRIQRYKWQKNRQLLKLTL